MERTDICSMIERIHPGIEGLSQREDLDDVLDSFDIMQLVEEVEMGCGIEVDPDDIIPENFSSVDAFARLVSRLESR